MLIPVVLVLASALSEVPFRDSLSKKGHGTSVLSALQSFLEHLQRDVCLQSRVQSAMTAAEVAMIAQEFGYPVSGGELLLLSGKSLRGMRVHRVDHPGEYPHRY